MMAGPSPFLLYASWALLSLTWTINASHHLSERCPVFFNGPRSCDPVAPTSFLPRSVAETAKNRSPQSADATIFTEILSTLNVTQSDFFAPWLGTWPDSIDWTAAVIGTHISAATRSLSDDLEFLNPGVGGIDDWRQAANLVDSYFAQAIAYYFGQDAFAIRDEAYDDILWVVLGWLETIKFVDSHGGLYYADSVAGYHGSRWISTFANRARIFWGLASRGWDTKLCNGGMVWNPRLQPYKNAITNELYIAASISMYLHFPGDDNSPPFRKARDPFNPKDPDAGRYSGPRDARYLKAAVDGYRWLHESNMTNHQGLFIDGFHISGYLDKKNNNTKCDSRDEMVFTYNQGVVLTGQRGLWDATGAASYLADGHKLIQNVINATGYDLASDKPTDNLTSATKPGFVPRWHGLGRVGVLEEYCDASGTCSQDGQTFKGIFFHHLTTFCAPLEAPQDHNLFFDVRAFAAVRTTHTEACASYVGWLRHNVHAALGTKDKRGHFGQWWTAGLLASNRSAGCDPQFHWPTLETDGIPRGPNMTDYRNYGVPDDEVWIKAPKETPAEKEFEDDEVGQSMDIQQAHFSAEDQVPMIRGRSSTSVDVDVDVNVDDTQSREHWQGRYVEQTILDGHEASVKDPNDRGRGRTVETQSGGLALLRAYWTIARAVR